MYRIGQEELEALARVLASGRLSRVGDGEESHPAEVRHFEEELCQVVGTSHALCLSGGGTAALVGSLVGLEIGPGDEVIVPAYTWIATATAVLTVGAIPVLAEVDETLTLDPADLERKIGPATRAVIPVHMVGRAAHMEHIVSIARARGLAVVEDACQAMGGSFRGRRLGAWGDAGAYSFNAMKLLTCGEGGALVTSRRALYERALVWHDSGSFARSWAEGLTVPIFIGAQLRASELMGAMLRAQLARLEAILGELRALRRRFEDALAAVPGLAVAPSHDRDGDCGLVVALRFADEARARAFATARGVNGWLPIDSGKHVYTRWTPLLDKRIGHHPALDPFQHPANQGLRTDYAPDSCPRTLEHLARTVFLDLDVDVEEPFVVRRIAACTRAAAAATP